jgi:hypothetical protein
MPSMPIVNLSAKEMEGFAHAWAENPAAAKLNELTVQEAERVGGLGLKTMRLFRGLIFGDPVMMTLDEVAARLGVSEESVVAALDPITKAAAARWVETEEFKQWRSPENFSYINFSVPALETIERAARLAFEADDNPVTINHLRAVLDLSGSLLGPTGGRTQQNFDEGLATLLRRAHAAAVGAGETVELRHIRDALQADAT